MFLKRFEIRLRSISTALDDWTRMMIIERGQRWVAPKGFDVRYDAGCAVPEAVLRDHRARTLLLESYAGEHVK